MTTCPRCNAPAQLDTQFLMDAQKYGVLDESRRYYRCLNSHSYWTIVPDQIPDEKDKVCANPGCGGEIGPGRRRFCRDECARPRKGKRKRRRPVN